MGLLTFAGRIVLVVTNVIFVLVSLCLIVLGFMIRYANDIIRPFVKDQLDSIKQTVKDLYGYEIDTDSFDLGEMVSTFCLFLILAGLFLLALSFLGCCGSCYGFKLLMLLYAIILTVLVLAQSGVAVLIYQFPEMLKSNMESPMKSTLKEYQGINGTTAVTLGWNWAMRQYDCCGVKDYQDFNGQPMWFADGKYLTPVSCCKTLPSDETARKMCAGDTSDPSYNTIDKIASNSNYNTGCLDAVWETLIEDNKTYVLLGIGFAAALQAALIMFAFLIWKDRGIKGGLV